MSSETLGKIEKAARKVFQEKGYAETRIADIANEAGISPGAIYNYYKSKKELFASLELPNLENKRPEFEKKRRDIMNVALQQFGQLGYQRTTMENIAEGMGVSKAMLYQYFSSKEEILNSIVRDNAIVSLLGDLPEAGDISDITHKIGLEFLKMYNEPEKLSLLRTIICESPSYPELGRFVFDKTINEAHEQIAVYLQRAQAMGLLRTDNPKLAARVFLGTLLSFVVVDKLINSQDEFSQEEIVSGVTSIFLNGISK